MKNKEYSLGFLFSKDYRTVALIKKSHPKWQKGLLNGIGGKKKLGEPMYKCMVREFEEETGLHFENWEHFLDIGNDSFIVSCYKGIYENLKELVNVTEETIQIENVALILAVGYKDMIPNLRWILPFALDNEAAFSKINYQ